MARFTRYCFVVVLAVTACTVDDTTSTTKATDGVTTTTTAIGDDTPNDRSVAIITDATEVVGGASVELTAVGLGDNPTWSVDEGSIVGRGAMATYTAPKTLGEFEVTASDGSATASVSVLVYEATIYDTDFATSIGEEWTTDRTTTSPSGEQFLGEFGDNWISLSFEELPTHDEVSITFDLYVLRSWDGLSEEDSWVLEIDGTPVISTTFSNGESLQAWPGNLPYASNPARSGATSNETLGYWYETENDHSDSIYRVERAFFHEGEELVLDFAGNHLGELSDESWGIDNIEVKISQTPPSTTRPEPSLLIDIDGRDMTVRGAVPDPSVETTVVNAAADHFGGWNLTLDLEPLEGALTPRWTTQLADILEDLEDAVDLTLEFGLRAGSADGSVVTDRYRGEIIDLVESQIGKNGTVSDSIELIVDQSLVDHITNSEVYFDTGSSAIKPEAEITLDGIADILMANERMGVIAIGHTDVTGADQANEWLSWERAEAAIAYMESRGVPHDRLTVNGKGSEEPARQGDTPDAYSANRRVEFIVLDG